jgi:hypothetical protein
MDVAVRRIASFRNGSGARSTCGGRSFCSDLLVLSVGAVFLCGPNLPQSLDAQLHHQPTLETVVQARHARNIDGNTVIDLARKADKDGNIKECIRALVEARRLFDFGD